MKESSIVASIIREVKKAYPRIYIRKISDRFTRGMPDILMIVPYLKKVWTGNMRNGFLEYQDHEYSIALLVECKTVKGKTSKLQEIELQLIRNSGAKAILATDAEAVIKTLEDIRAIK